jgi:hypothetical protein
MGSAAFDQLRLGGSFRDVGGVPVDPVAVAGLAVASASVLTLAWQTRSVAVQTRVANEVATAGWEATSHLLTVYQVFIERPELRQFFYDGIAPPNDKDQKVRVECVAEMLGDIIEGQLHPTGLRTSRTDLEDWRDFAAFILANSPAMRALVLEHPWHPHMREVLRSSSTTHPEG